MSVEFAPDGERIVWEDGPAGTGHYTVTAGPVARQGEHYCRSFLAEVLGDEGSAALGTACRGPDGSWVRSL